MGGSTATVVPVTSADEAIALFNKHQPSAVRLLANRSRHAVDVDGDALTVSLDGVLFSVPPADRREAWAETIRRVVGHLENLTSLAIEEIALSPGALAQAAIRSPGLTSLSCYDCAVDDAGTHVIAKRLPNLTTLNLDRNQVGDTGAQAIAEHLPNLTTLNLDRNQVSDTGAQAIAEHLPNLTTLNLGHGKVGSAGARAIAEHLTQLTTLRLGGNQVGDAGAQAIAKHLPDLTTLDLDRNQVGDAGARAIAEHLTQLTTLNLWHNRISDAGAQAIAKHLPNLTTLDLGANAIGDAGTQAIAEHLTQLTTLSLWDNGIGDGGARAIAGHLTQLTTLNLWNNGIGDAGTRAIAEHLTQLTTLRLGGNQVGDTGARAIAKHLPNLTSLDLDRNQVGDPGIRAIAEHLTQLTTLSLWNNGIGDGGARAIAEHLTQLTTLNLWNNGIGDAGTRAIAEHLTQLTTLRLGGNQVGDTGARAIAKHLPNLTALDLDGNGVTDTSARAIAEHLPNLTYLDLDGNGVSDTGAWAIAKHLPNLTSLHLEGNRVGEPGIRALLDALAHESTGRLRFLSLTANPGTEVLGLPEIAQSMDAPAILASYRRLVETDEGDKVAFGEAKLVVLGDEAVGKTSLVRALVVGERSDPNEQKTQGVNHRIWVRPWAPSDGEKTQLNIWDFGGQEIMHQTHRYFLTERCILIIVLDRRKQDDTSVVTWLRVARHRAPNSPVVVVINKCDDGTHNLDVDFVRLQQDHPEIVGVFNVSCSPDESVMTLEDSMAPLRDCLRRLLTDDPRLDSVRARVPKAWVRVRDEVRARANQAQVLSATEFVNLCQNADNQAERVTDPAEQRALLGMLHQMGVVVAHGLTPETTSLAGLTLLDPNWFTGAVYALLDYGTAEFDRNTLSERLRRVPDRAPLYPDSRLDYIIDLLQQPQFALAFRLPGTTDPPRYLLPEALKPNAPGAIAGWDRDSLRFRFRYRHLPRGLIPQFQVFAHPYARPGDDRWRTGCTLEVDDCPVLVDGNLAQNRIDIRVTGPQARRRDALAVVRSVFALVHDRMPESEPTGQVPLPDKPDVDVRYQYLCTLETEEGPYHRFRPDGGDRKYSVAELLHGVRSNRIPDPDNTPDTKQSQAQHITVINQPQGGATPESAPADPGDGLERGAILGQAGTIVGGVVGAICAAFYLLGQDDGWPSGVVLGGATAGGVTGGLVGFLLGVRRRRRRHLVGLSLLAVAVVLVAVASIVDVFGRGDGGAQAARGNSDDEGTTTTLDGGATPTTRPEATTPRERPTDSTPPTPETTTSTVVTATLPGSDAPPLSEPDDHVYRATGDTPVTYATGRSIDLDSQPPGWGVSEAGDLGYTASENLETSSHIVAIVSARSTREQCEAAQPRQTNVTREQTEVGTRFCVKTSEGRWAYVEIVAFGVDRDTISLHFMVYEDT